MGDLVASGSAGDVDQLHAHFNHAIDRQNRDNVAELASPLTITLGDEFQGLVTSLAAAAMIARTIRLDLLDFGIGCRFVVGLVSLSTTLNTDRAWNMMGRGLSTARAKLNEKDARSYYRFSLPDNLVTETLLDAAGATMTAIEKGWTPTQRRDIAALLRGEMPADIAARRDVSVHSVYKVRSSGDYDLYTLQISAMHEALAGLDRRYALARRP